MPDEPTGATYASVVKYLCEQRWEQHGCINAHAPAAWALNNIDGFGPMLERYEDEDSNSGGWYELDPEDEDPEDEDDGRCIVHDVRMSGNLDT